MDRYPLPGDLRSMNAGELAWRLCSGKDPEKTRPFWADGGSTASGRFAPGGHVLAAHPTRTGSVAVESLPFRGLADWLRSEARLSQRRQGIVALGLSYDAGRALERIPSVAIADPILPDVVFAEYPAFLQSNSSEGPWELFASDQDAANQLIATLRERSEAPPPLSFSTDFEEKTSWTEYAPGIEEVLRAIHAGELYQANIARRIEADMKSDLAPALYLRLHRSNPAAYGTLWCIGKDSWIASSSPECLFTYDAPSRTAHSFPIKGTRPRGSSMDEDTALEHDLKSDPKELAEHVMIVDLVRNDLGRVCKPGSVEVDALASPYRLPTVHHLVSDIRGTLSESCDLVDLLLALFPGGSITGAPKIAAMEKIEKVEGLRRGFYTGSIGLIDPMGSADFNILIRTCVAHSNRLYYQTGGGIVADSIPKKEWDETCAKAHALTSLFNNETESCIE